MKPQPSDEKVFKIGKYRIKYGTICVFALVIIIGSSSFGYYFTSLSAPSDVEKTRDGAVPSAQARAIVYFSNKTIVSKFVTFEQGDTAATLFKKVANVSTTISESGAIVTQVQAGDKLAVNNETDFWVFYVNGLIKFTGIDKYTVQHGDTLELRYEHEPF